MTSVDQATQAGLDTICTTAKLTTTVLDMFLSNLLEKIKNEKRKGNSIIDEPKTKQGKQKLKDLLKKHEKSNIVPLDSNITKEEMKAYKKEFKEMGVDFSVMKVDKDSYSVFFAGKDSETIEKALENVVQKRSQKIKKDKIKKDKRTDRKEAFKYNMDKLRFKQKNIDKEEKGKEKNHEHKKDSHKR